MGLLRTKQLIFFGPCQPFLLEDGCGRGRGQSEGCVRVCPVQPSPPPRKKETTWCWIMLERLVDTTEMIFVMGTDTLSALPPPPQTQPWMKNLWKRHLWTNFQSTERPLSSRQNAPRGAGLQAPAGVAGSLLFETTLHREPPFGDNFDSPEKKRLEPDPSPQTTNNYPGVNNLSFERSVSLSLSLSPQTHTHTLSFSLLFYCNTTLQLPPKFVIVVDQV